MTIDEYLSDRIDASKEALEYSKQKIESLPHGNLEIKIIRGKERFYLHSNGSDYYINNKTELIQQLQEKEYCLKLKSAAEKELKALRRVQSILDKTPGQQTVFTSIPEKRRNLIRPFEPSSVEIVRKEISRELKYLEKESLNRKTVNKNINLITLNEERVRSKSELIIADRLKFAGIPYIYEGKLVFKDKTDILEVWFPDFQMFNIRTGEKYYWEHFGLMDNPEYCASCQFKLEAYAKQGIVIGKNLIITMECSTHILNTEYVDRLINEFLK